MLEVLGMDAAEEALYETLIGHGPLGTDELRRTLPDLDPVEDVLTSMVDRGLVRRPEGPDGRYTAVAPEMALQSLVMEREHALHRARSRMAELAELHDSSPHTLRESPVEFVPGSEAVARFHLLHRSAREQMRGCEAPPYSVRSGAPNPDELANLARGVRYRAVYGRAAVAVQTVPQIQRGIEAGEQARVIGEVPLRFAIVDDRVAMLPAKVGGLMTEGMLLVWPCALLDALAALFEMVWAQARPLTMGAADEPGADRTALVALLASGLGDQAIANHLGMGTRTVQRRIQELMASVNAVTRFQAGVALGRLQRAGD